jgi:large subunit ribosomal protein L21
MYAIIENGGRQFKVEEGFVFQIDYKSDLAEGDEITFDRVLMVRTDEENVAIGEPVVDGATVTAKVLGGAFGPKLTVQKFRRRKNSRTRTGHRQPYTKVRVEKINAG